jgi:hypothetical protein
MKDSLSAALKDFYDWIGSEDGENNFIKLGINDMCLQWGGAFDFPGLWNFNDQHSFHRVGLSVDIDNMGLQIFVENPNPIQRKIKATVPKLTPRGNKLEALMKKYNGIKYQEDQIHFGFDNQN